MYIVCKTSFVWRSMAELPELSLLFLCWNNDTFSSEHLLSKSTSRTYKHQFPRWTQFPGKRNKEKKVGMILFIRIRWHMSINAYLLMYIVKARQNTFYSKLLWIVIVCTGIKSIQCYMLRYRKSHFIGLWRWCSMPRSPMSFILGMRCMQETLAVDGWFTYAWRVAVSLGELCAWWQRELRGALHHLVGRLVHKSPTIHL